MALYDPDATFGPLDTHLVSGTAAKTNVQFIINDLGDARLPEPFVTARGGSYSTTYVPDAYRFQTSHAGEYFFASQGYIDIGHGLICGGIDAPFNVATKKGYKTGSVTGTYNSRTGTYVASATPDRLDYEFIDLGEMINDVSTALTIADGVDLTNRYNIPIGVSMYDIPASTYWRGDGRHGALLTRAYLELPYFNNGSSTSNDAYTSAGALKIGCVYDGHATALETGDYVQVGTSRATGHAGKFRRISGDGDPRLLIGQVKAIRRRMPPPGWLETVQYQLYAHYRTGAQLRAYPADGVPPGYNEEWAPEWPGTYHNPFRGQKGMTDGANYYSTIVTRHTISAADVSAGSLSLTVRITQFNGLSAIDATTFQVKNVTDGGSLSTTGIASAALDSTNGEVTWTYTLQGGDGAGDVLEFQFKATGQVPGVPVNLNSVSDALGLARILLLF